MRTRVEPVLYCRGKDGFGLVQSEGVAFAEDVDESRQLLARSLGNHLVSDQADVGIAIGFELRGDHMRPEQRGDNSPWPSCGGTFDGAQGFHLRVEVQPVSG